MSEHNDWHHTGCAICRNIAAQAGIDYDDEFERPDSERADVSLLSLLSPEMSIICQRTEIERVYGEVNVYTRNLDEQKLKAIVEKSRSFETFRIDLENFDGSDTLYDDTHLAFDVRVGKIEVDQQATNHAITRFQFLIVREYEEA